MSVYVDVKTISFENYTEYEQGFIKEFMESAVKFKECQKCMKAFPLTDVFFAKEKRIKDGFENSCKLCRGKVFKYTGRKIVRPIINKDLISKFNNIEIYEHYLKANELPYITFMQDNRKEILLYLIEDKYKLTDQEIVNINRDWIKERKLYGVLLRQYNGSIVEMINSLYPERFVPWQFANVGRSYWKNEGNRIKALKWIVDKLFIDKIIEYIEDIPSVLTGYVFEEYGLGVLLNTYYNNSPYEAIDCILPNKFHQWEYSYVSADYWTKENRVTALKNLIEDRLNIKVENIPKVLSYEFFTINHRKDCRKFKHIIDEYYNLKIIEYIKECYPNVFKDCDFYYKNHYPTLDGLIVKSEPERIIHHILVNSGLDVRYEDKECRFYDEEYDQNYRPDWSIRYDDKIIIVEYYGMLIMNDIDYGYEDKYNKKHKFYNQLCEENEEYIYVPLYSKDIRKDISGLVSKFKEIGIELSV